MKFLKFMFTLILMSFCSMCFAQEGAEILSNTDFFELLISSLGGIKGASTLVIVGIVIKLLLAFFSSELGGKVFKKLDGEVKLLIVAGLSLIGGVSGLMIATDISLGAAILHSSSMSAVLVFVNQIYKHFVTRKK